MLNAMARCMTSRNAAFNEQHGGTVDIVGKLRLEHQRVAAVRTRLRF